MNCICIFENNLNFFATGWRNRSVVADRSAVARCLPKQRAKLRRSEVFVECPTKGISLRFSIYGTPFPSEHFVGTFVFSMFWLHRFIDHDPSWSFKR